MPPSSDSSTHLGPLAEPTAGRWKAGPEARSGAGVPPASGSQPETAATHSAAGTVPELPGAATPAGAPPPATAGAADDWLGDDRIPAWLVSLILHVALVLLLAMLTTTAGDTGSGDVLRVGWAPAAAPTTPLMRVEAADSSTQDAEESAATAEPVDVAIRPDQARVEVTSPAAAQPQPVTDSSTLALAGGPQSLPLTRNLSGGRLGDRSGAGRSAAVAAGAVTAESEAAMEEALRWLAAHQHNDGGWSFRLNDPHGPCDGKCKNPIANPDDAPTPRTAATGLALLAFLGAGHTHQSGEYSETVRRGIYFLRSQARETSFGTDLQNGSMYGHGIATLALAEAYVLSGDEDLRELIAGAAAFCATAQNEQGGWGYIPGGPADITLTAWQIVALKTAEQRKIWSPTDVIPDAKRFLLTLANESRNRFGYKTPEPRLSTTAIGLLLQLYFGYTGGETSMIEGLEYLVEQGPSPTDVYYDYYAMLVLHHTQHRGRMDFARELRNHLLATQAKSGHEAGSWFFVDRYGSVGGRLYTTAMCALILQTPYRYVPLAGGDEPFQL